LVLSVTFFVGEVVGCKKKQKKVEREPMDSVGLSTDRGVFKNLLKMGAKNKEVE
jgi:hypothetical protein